MNMTFGRKNYDSMMSDFNSNSNMTFGKSKNENENENEDLDESVIFDLDMISISNNFEKFYKKKSYLNSSILNEDEENIKYEEKSTNKSKNIPYNNFFL